MENYTAAMSLPYRDGCGGHTHNSGLSFVDPAVLRAAVTRLDAEGFQVHVHAIGDRAVAEALDAFAARPGGQRPRRRPAPRRAPPGRRARRPAAVRRARRDREHPGAVGGQRRRDDRDDAAVHRRGVGRLAVPVRRRSPRAGVRLAAGSDWPVSTPDPLAALHVAVNRVDADEPPAQPFLPERGARRGAGVRGVHQRLGAREPPRRHRRAGARACWPTSRCSTGTRSPATRPAIGATRVVATYVDGRPVYRA